MYIILNITSLARYIIRVYDDDFIVRASAVMYLCADSEVFPEEWVPLHAIFPKGSVKTRDYMYMYDLMTSYITTGNS